jgi:DNA topoisomerase-1
MIFEGYRKIYQDVKKEDEEEEVVGGLFGDVSVGTKLKNEKIVSTEKYQNPPPRYSEATIIKKMEVAGIGRPSTYASILNTLFERDYVEKKNMKGMKKDGKSFILQATKSQALGGQASVQKKNIMENKIEITIGGEKNKLVPTEIGKRTSHYLEEHFPNIMNETFTSSMESRLDEIAAGTHRWDDSVGEYYQSFHRNFPWFFSFQQFLSTIGQT